jgi:amylosucrase
VSSEARGLDPYGELESVLSSDGVLPVRNGQLRLPGLGFVWLAEP